MPHDPDNLSRPPTPDPLVEALARLTPAPATLNRDQLMFRAGAESRRGVIRLWQATAGFLAAVGFTAGMYFRSPVVIEKIVPVSSEKFPANHEKPGAVVIP